MCKKMQVKAEKPKKTSNQVYLHFHMNWLDLKCMFVWWEVIDLMFCDDSVVNLLFVRFDTVKSALSVGLIFLQLKIFFLNANINASHSQ